MSRKATPLRTTFVLAIGLLTLASSIPMTAMAGTRAEPEVWDPSGDAHAGVAVAQLGANAMPADGSWDITRVFVNAESLDAVFVTVSLKDLDDAAEPRPAFTTTGQYAVPADAVEESRVQHEVLFTQKGKAYKAVVEIAKFKINEEDPLVEAQRLVTRLTEDLTKANNLAKSRQEQRSGAGGSGTSYAGLDDIQVPSDDEALAGLVATISGTITTLQGLVEEVGAVPDSVYPLLYGAVDELAAASRDPAGYSSTAVLAALQTLEDQGVAPPESQDPSSAADDALTEFADASDGLFASIGETLPDGGKDSVKELGGKVMRFVEDPPTTYEELRSEAENLTYEIQFVTDLINSHIEPPTYPDARQTYNDTRDAALEVLANGTDVDWWNEQIQTIVDSVGPILLALREIVDQIDPNTLPGQVDNITKNLTAAAGDRANATDSFLENETGISLLKAKAAAERLAEELQNYDLNDALPPECSYTPGEPAPSLECDPEAMVAMVNREIEGLINNPLVPDVVRTTIAFALAQAEWIDEEVRGMLGEANPLQYVPDILDELAKTEDTLDYVEQYVPTAFQPALAALRANYTAVRGQLEALRPITSSVPTEVPPLPSDTNGDGLPDVELPLARVRYDGPTGYAVAPATPATIAAKIADATREFEATLARLGVTAPQLPLVADYSRYVDAARAVAPTTAFVYQAWLQDGAQRVELESTMDVRTDSVTVRLPKDTIGSPGKGDEMSKLWATAWVDGARIDMAPQPRNADAETDVGQAAQQGRLVQPTFGKVYRYAYEAFGGRAAARIDADVLGTAESTIRDGGFAVYTVEFANPGTAPLRGMVTLSAPAPGWTHQASRSVIELAPGETTTVAITVAKIADGAKEQVTTVSFTPEGGQAQQVFFTTSMAGAGAADGGDSPGLGLVLVLAAVGLVGVLAGRRRRA